MKYLTTAAMALVLAAAGAAEAQQPQGQNGQPHTQGQGGQNGHGGQGQGRTGQGGHSGQGQGGGQGQRASQTFLHGAHGGFAGQSGGGQGQGGGATTYQQRFTSGGHGGFTGQGGGTQTYQHYQGGQAQPHFTGQGGPQGHFNGQGPGAHPSGFGFQEHARRSRDQGRVYYDAHAFAHEVRAVRRFHVAPYAYPHGWYVRTWYYGDFLPWGWFAPGYYLDWADYGLPPPPIGCEWVRVGPDALLVDIWTGEVLSVYRNVFW
jgi:Ni/Co efflux regulator RcnB